MKAKALANELRDDLTLSGKIDIDEVAGELGLKITPWDLPAAESTRSC